MSDTDALNARIEKLETRIAFQDQNIEDLNKTITGQWAQFDKLRRDISRLGEQLADISTNSGETGAPPPHY